MKRILKTVIVTASIFTGLSALAGTGDIGSGGLSKADEQIKELQDTMKDYAKFRTRAQAYQDKVISTSVKLKEHRDCINKNDNDSCVNAISIISMGLTEGYDQDTFASVENLKAMPLNEHQKIEVQRLSKINDLLAGPIESSAPNSTCDQQAERDFELARHEDSNPVNPAYGDFYTAANNRAMAKYLICINPSLGVKKIKDFKRKAYLQLLGKLTSMVNQRREGLKEAKKMISQLR